jgi:acid phosphatase (class A)
MDLSDAAARQRLVQDEDRKSIQRTYGFTVFTFDSVFGPDFTPRNYPRTEAFFAKLMATTREVVSGLKEHYKRLRPFEGHPDQIQLLVRHEPGYSYPSGHTTRSRLCALVLGELDPGKRKAINQVAERVGLDRILAGEHYLTDIEGGRKLAKILYSCLNKNPDFRAELAEVKAAEWTHPPSGPKSK